MYPLRGARSSIFPDLGGSDLLIRNFDVAFIDINQVQTLCAVFPKVRRER